MTNTIHAIKKPKSTVVFLRGLRARTAWANAKGIFDADCRAMDIDYAQILAHVQGREDFSRGRNLADIPPLLADVAQLTSAWVDGWYEVEESVALAACSCCNDGSGNPCPHHG
ncbi:hypothetical protein [Achromobacter kerstersii]|uniref:hypothetical protein n=1 Tax=Achromobacter kerstersii TaxID=1353890 RepID=UPI0006C34230|nr:hypothetical protein [Achromobacter kerstersii]CUJ49434.1 Uncharacterised protein [Achromobacter kerstersii]